MDSAGHTITRLLARARRGDPAARDELCEITYERLKRMARGFLAGERRDHTLQATALVHEVQIELLAREDLPGENGKQFLGYVARAMRHLLVDHARARGRVKRGGGQRRRFDEQLLFASEPDAQILEIDEALERLERLDARKCRVVELRFFAGLGGDEIAQVLGVSPATVDREWRVARRWLYAELAD